ncbi:MAG TPA: hypothetical protein VH834_11055 [Solirubrobacteraceae bacterium]
MDGPLQELAGKRVWLTVGTGCQERLSVDVEVAEDGWLHAMTVVEPPATPHRVLVQIDAIAYAEIDDEP